MCINDWPKRLPAIIGSNNPQMTPQLYQQLFSKNLKYTGYSGYSVPRPFSPFFPVGITFFKNFFLFLTVTAITPEGRELGHNRLLSRVTLAYSNC